MKLKSSGHASLKSFNFFFTGTKSTCVNQAKIRIADTYSLSCTHIATCIYYYITILAVVEFSMIFQAYHICMYKGILKIIVGTYTRCQQKKVKVTM